MTGAALSRTRHLVFGGVLETELPFPELPPAPDTAQTSWTLERRDTEPPPLDATSLGGDDVDQGITVELFKLEEGFRLVYSDTGTFDLFERGDRIVWYPGTAWTEKTARIDVLGRVLAVALHARGELTLHASAAAFDRGTIAFIAPKLHGKSTTALAVVRSGARLVTDDTLGVTIEEKPRAVPGVHAVRLWSDSADRVGTEDAAVDANGPGGKLLISDLPADSLMYDRTPLNALYLLAPVLADEAEAAATRVRLQPFEATLALLGQTKIGALLGGVEAPTVLGLVTHVADHIPVYRLHIARDFEQLPAAVERLREWHADLIEGGSG